MKLFRQLLSRKPQSSKPENRLNRLADEPLAALEALVAGSQGDPDDMEMRVGALQRLPYSAVVRNVAFSGPPALERAARIRLASLIDSGEVGLSQLITDIEQPEKLLAIAGLCKTTDLQDQVLAGIQDQRMLADICTKTPSAAVRQTLARRIDEPDLLKALAQAFKSKDKSTYKIIKGKLDAIKAEKDAQVELENQIAKLCSDAEQHSQRAFDKDYSFRLHGLERRWGEVAEQTPADETQRITAALEICRERVEQAESESKVEIDAGETEAVSTDIAESPLEVAAEPAAHEISEVEHVDQETIQEALQETKEAREEREARQKHLRVIKGLLRRSQSAVEQGRLKQALGIRHSIDEKLPMLDKLPNGIADQLGSLDEGIQKLIDWQAYAVVPKKEALVESMEALVGAELPPEALATKIKKLQDEWKELAQSGKDRQEDLWQRFSDAADKAYEPCKAFYQELAVVRKQNLEKRRVLVKQLQDYVEQNDWDNADWRQVEKVLHSARQELHSYTPVDRSANKSVLSQFDEAMAAIQAKLEGEYSKNKHTKEQIVAQAEKLATTVDIDQAIEAAKRLQAQWKTIGRCNYKENECLWKQFRQHCDSIFARKQNAMAEQNAVLEENLGKAKNLIDDLKNLTKLSGEEFLATRADRDQIKASFAEVGDLPPKSEKSTQRAFFQVLEQYDEKVKQQVQQADQDAWNTLFSINEDINGYLLAVSGNDPDASLLRDAVTEKITQNNRWPEGAQSKVKQKLDEMPSGDLKTNQERLRLLCIRAEILGDVASPDEDKAKRMEYQVNLLQKGLGQATAASPETLALDWVEVGPVPADVYQILFQRFQSVWQKLK